jgi:hypothetical protein
MKVNVKIINVNIMDKQIRKQQIADWKRRPFSWSQYSSWQWNKEEWFDKYILNKTQGSSPELDFGSWIGKKLERDPKFLPQITRHSKMEHPFKVNLCGIELIGYADSFCDKTNKKLKEFKTGVKEWNQKRVDEHGQLDMYLLMNYITNKIKPEDVEVQLIWMPTQRKESGTFEVVIDFVPDIENNIKIFNTKRTMVDILKFASYIKKTWKDMQVYAKKYDTN